MRGRGYGPGLSYTLSIRNFFNTTEMDFVEDSLISKRKIRVKYYVNLFLNIMYIQCFMTHKK